MESLYVSLGGEPGGNTVPADWEAGQAQPAGTGGLQVDISLNS